VRRIIGQPAGAALVVAMLAVCLVVPSPAAVAAPTNAKIRTKQSEAAKADTKLQRLSDTLELRQTDLQAVTDALNGTRDDIVQTEARLAEAQSKLDDSQARLAERAEAIYRNGSVDLLDVLVGVTDFTDFISRMDMLDRIEKSDSDLVVQVSADRDRVDQARTSLLNRESEQEALRQEATVQEREVEAAVAQQKSYVASLSHQIKNLVKAEELRRERVAAAAARNAARSGSQPDGRTSDAGSLGPSHPEAAAEAKRYLGVRYVWGGTTPSGFDCSGLVQYCYRKIGIAIPRTSRSQFTIGQFIPRSRKDLLAAGDLVFFGYDGDASRIHHVGMYVGGGSFIHAPATGDHVKYTLLSSRSDYVGAVRP
jgi:cell wall-associated NlpC family hydrolase